MPFPGPAGHGHGQGRGRGYGDVGQWLSDALGHLVGRIGPLAALLLVPPAVGLVVAGVLAGRVARELRVDASGREVRIDGLDTGPLWLAAAALVATLVVSAVGWLAAHHQLHQAHAGLAPSLGRSVAAGLRRLPRLIGWGLVGLVASAVVIGLVAGAFAALAVAAGSAADSAVPVALVALLVVPALAVASIWLAIRWSLALVAIAVAPAGTNPFAASWRITRRQWWATLGRLLLMTLILIGVSLVFSIVNQIVFGAASLGLTAGPDGELLVDGRPVVVDDVVDFSDVVPGDTWIITTALVSSLSQAVQQAISIAATVGLYVRGGGPGEG